MKSKNFLITLAFLVINILVLVCMILCDAHKVLFYIYGSISAALQILTLVIADKIKCG